MVRTGTALGLPRRTRVALLAHNLVILATAEVLFVFSIFLNNELLAFLGLLLDLFLMFSLVGEAAWMASKDPSLASFLAALVLVPLLRIVTLSIPLARFSIPEWLAIVSVPLLLAAAAVIRLLRLRARDVYLGLGERRYLPLNVTIAILGFPLGVVEWWILQPSAWITSTSLETLLIAAVAIFLATGLAEELIFRGVLLSTGVRPLGQRGSLLYGAVVFAILHIGFLNVADVFFAFIVGLIFGSVVLITKSLWGAVGAHTLLNLALFVFAPLF